MAQIPIDDLKPGMVLGADVTAVGGRVLLRAGVELNADHLRIFRAWGLVSADIVDGDSTGKRADVLADVDPARLTEIRKQVDARFVLTDLQHPVIAALHRWNLERACKVGGRA